MTNFEIQRYYQNEPIFNGVYSRINSHHKIKDGAYVVDLDEYADSETHWIALYSSNNDVTYFDNFGVEYIPEEIKKFIEDKNINGSSITTNIFSNVWIFLYWIY